MSALGEVLRERSMEHVQEEVRAFVGAFGEVASGAMISGDWGAVEQSVDEFAAALKGAIPAWIEGATVTKRQSDRRSEMGTTFTKGDVIGAATELAKKMIEREPQRFGKIADPQARLAAARTEVYRENPELRELHDGAQPDPTIEERVVHKGAEPFSKIDAAAREELPELYRSSPSRARSEITKLRPELQAEYHAAHGAR